MPRYRVIVNIGYVEVEVEAADDFGALAAAAASLSARGAEIVCDGTFQVEQVDAAEAAA